MPLNPSQFSPQGPGVDYDPHWYRKAVFYEVLGARVRGRQRGWYR